MEEFARRKAAALGALAEEAPDKSPKGAVDAAVVPLIDVLNRHPSYFTTSSCSGRISILAHPSPSPASAIAEGDSAEGNGGGSKEKASADGKKNKKKKAGGGGWIFVSHDPAEPEAIVDLLFGKNEQFPLQGDLVFRFEPLIVAVECCDVAAAQALVSTAISCGFRESGITNAQKRIMVAIRCSIRMEVPLGQVGSILISQVYLRYLVDVANNKMEANRRRTDKFFLVLQDKGLSESFEQITRCNRKNEKQIVDRGGSSDIQSDRSNLSFKLMPDGNSIRKVDDQANDFVCTEVELGSSYDEQLKEKRNHVVCNEHSEESLNLHGVKTGEFKTIVETDPNRELSRTSRCSLSIAMLKVVGEQIEKLFLWGQTACVLNIEGKEQIIVFGGFGGLGRHARRDSTLVLDPVDGHLREVDVSSRPSPRLGHTSSVIGSNIFVIGGRSDPTEILNDVWALQTSENTWSLLKCTGSAFSSRHRHAAAAVGSKIYVFGGLSNEVIYSCMHILNTETLEWSEVSIQGEWPCARHSHALLAIGSQIFMFGGYDGLKALGDLYKFDITSFRWEKINAIGRAPLPRFSHSMFAYKNFLGILGGCPVSQQYHELSLLNLENLVWLRVSIESLGKELLVRSSACLVNEELVIVGGGASCYAFGTKFSLPMKINLSSLEYNFKPFLSKNVVNHRQKTHDERGSQCKDSLDVQTPSFIPNIVADKASKQNGHNVNAINFALHIQKGYAKLAKDILKKYGWLDLSRKVHQSTDNAQICLPVTKNFHTLITRNELSENEAFVSAELSLLLSYGGLLIADDAVCSKKEYISPQKRMRELVDSLLKEKGMTLQLLEQLPTRWEHLGDILVLPKTSFTDPIWDSIGDILWPVLAKALGAQRLARQGRISPTGTRDSTLEILFGDNGWVSHRENGILYSFDASKCMFSWGNLSEKLRMAQLDCTNEVIVDLFAGIGYFVLPFLVKARAKLVYACEWNPHALEALQHNIVANSVADRCVILKGDNCVTAPQGVADRVCLGLLPSSEGSWNVAVRALRAEGGVLHVHGNVKDSEEGSWSQYLAKSISSISQTEGLCWDVLIEHVERVKWYGPRIRHLVVDIRCKQVQTK